MKAAKIRLGFGFGSPKVLQGRDVLIEGPRNCAVTLAPPRDHLSPRPRAAPVTVKSARDRWISARDKFCLQSLARPASPAPNFLTPCFQGFSGYCLNAVKRKVL